MNRERFESILQEAIDELPERFARHLGNVAIIVEDRPSRDALRAAGLDPRRDTLFGLYEGVPLDERGAGEAVLPDRITIFYWPLVRAFRTPARIRREIQKTLIHEIGHHFGLDDDTMEDLGY